MKTIALIEKGKDGSFGIYSPNIESTIIGDGNTVADAKADFENSLKEVIATYTDCGKDLPAELIDIEFDYNYDVASIFDYYNWINVTKFASMAGINASLMRQYKQGLTYISEEQVKKIENALHHAGTQLQAAQLI